MKPTRATLTVTLATILALVRAAHADLPANFNWHDEAVAKVAVNNPEALDSASTGERVRIVKILMHGRKPTLTGVMNLLTRTLPLPRFQVFRLLDKKDKTDLRTIYDKLGADQRVALLELCRESGAAAQAANLIELGIVSDIDDTAVPTQFHPDGRISFKGAADFYKLLEFGPDEKGEAGDLHFVSAEPKSLIPAARHRLELARLPYGTIDHRKIRKVSDLQNLDDIQKSKVDNIDLWLRLHPNQKFVFLGDDLQRAPEVYQEILKKHPESVAAVFIHKAGGNARLPAVSQNEIFFPDYPTAQKILIDRKIIGPGAKPGPGAGVPAPPAGP